MKKRTLVVLFLVLILSLSLLLVACAEKDDDKEGNYGDDNSFELVGATELNLMEKQMVLDNCLGAGVNVATAEYFNSNSCSVNSIFKTGAIESLTLYKRNLDDTKAKVEVTQSATDLYKSIESSLFAKMSMGYSSCFFTAGFKSNFSVDTKYENQTNIKKFNYYSTQNIGGVIVSLPSPAITENYYALLDDGFISRVQKVQSGKITEKEFFETYGTHILGSAIYGARAEVCYSLYTESNITEEVVKAGLEAAVNASYCGERTSLQEQFNTAFSDTESVNMSKSEFNAHLWGGEGKNIDLFSFESFNAGYKTWLDSVGNKEEYFGSLVGVANNGLIPIWKYIPEEYAETANKLQDYFLEYIDGTYSEFKDFYSTEKREPSIYDAEVSVERLDMYKIYDGDGGGKNTMWGLHNKRDSIPLTDFDMEALKEDNGYIKIQMTFNICTFDKGYREFYVYDRLWDSNKGADTKFDGYLAQIYDYTVPFLAILGNPIPQYNTCTFYIPATEFEKDGVSGEYYIYLCYDCHGEGDDTWGNKDMKITVTAEKEPTASMLYSFKTTKNSYYFIRTL